MNQRKRRGCDDSQSNILTSSTFTFSPLLVFSIRKELLVEREIINPFQDIVEGIKDQLTCGCRWAPSIMAQCIRIRVMPTRTGDKFLSGATPLDLVLAWPSTWPVIVRSFLQTKDSKVKGVLLQTLVILAWYSCTSGIHLHFWKPLIKSTSGKAQGTSPISKRI